VSARVDLAPGLTLDWLNGWLAALGVTVLVPDVRLGWTSDVVPSACFTLAQGASSVAEMVGEALPSVDDLGALAIARQRSDGAELGRRVGLDTYLDRAALARRSGDTSLSSTLTDLVAELPKEGLPHSPFDPPMPKGVTLWERLVACREAIVDPRAEVEATFAGIGRRVAGNGLGFDARRLVAGVRDAGPRIDPLLEVLAFCGLALFPFRGNGTQSRARGWTGPAGRRGSFQWCAWAPPLDRWAIDALLDMVGEARTSMALAGRLGISRWYRTVPYQAKGAADSTRAYGAERLP
jgi:hypothetical protein